jgi:hypothetical protein
MNPNSYGCCNRLQPSGTLAVQDGWQDISLGGVQTRVPFIRYIPDPFVPLTCMYAHSGSDPRCNGCRERAPS